MIRFVIKRLSTLIPTVFGISLVTFILVNLAIGSPSSGVGTDNSRAAVVLEDDGRAYGLHLPMFINFSIQDVRTRAARDIRRLGNLEKRQLAVRSLVGTGGAVIPYLVPALSQLEGEGKEAALDALDQIAVSIGRTEDVPSSPKREAFWVRYWDIHSSDFTPVRSARLVRRYAKREDHLALAELRRLHTYCLPELMGMLDEEISLGVKGRIVGLLCEFTNRDDPFNPDWDRKERAAVISRWKEWWNQRYDLYTSFEGLRRVTGTITETRYFQWLSRVITFDFGVSARDGRPIRTKIAERLPITLLLSCLALMAAYLIAIPLGVITAIKRGSLFDRVTTMVLFVAYSLPAFWVAMLLLRYVGSTGHLDWFPAQGLSSPDAQRDWPWWKLVLDTGHHLVLPVLCLSFVSIAMLARYQRIGMLRIAEQDFMRTARAKGLSNTRVILKHGLRNGVIPLITMMGLQLPFLVSGSVIIERIFGIQGMGLETFEAIRASDYFWLMAVVTVTAVLTMLGMLASDVIYALVDPRIVPGRRLWRRK